MPKLMLPDDKEEVAAGPATSMAALVGGHVGGEYWVDCRIGAPGEHATSENDARKLWEYSLAQELDK